MYEKLIKCAAKTGFEIQRYIPRTHEMKNRILSKNKGCMFFLLSKIYQLPEYYMTFARKILFLPNLEGQLTILPLSPTPMALSNFQWLPARPLGLYYRTKAHVHYINHIFAVQYTCPL